MISCFLLLSDECYICFYLTGLRKFIKYLSRILRNTITSVADIWNSKFSWTPCQPRGGASPAHAYGALGGMSSLRLLPKILHLLENFLRTLLTTLGLTEWPIVSFNLKKRSEGIYRGLPKSSQLFLSLPLHVPKSVAKQTCRSDSIEKSGIGYRPPSEG